ncbi:MAG TPA: hypothetical protein VER11_34180 [Polyangiaceae bacterium]|nr:hypothetical protein [Polyangiaceae bacterium]
MRQPKHVWLDVSHTGADGRQSVLRLQPQTPLGEEQVGLSGVAHTTAGPAVQLPFWQMSA